MNEIAKRAIAERRQRVVRALESGRSRSSIARDEGVKRATIEKDIKAILAVNPEILKGGRRYVIGRDGKTYPAKQPSAIRGL